ncbi:MAG: biopolymer transporter ExbD [Deltaproteobacteria bacterium]|nr:biopolymer transporter ExbD [Deltaproteobacteria bacterium]
MDSVNEKNIPKNDTEEISGPPPRKKKKSRLEEHEYPLNITAMMDMMTIILVYLLKSYSSDPTNITPQGDLSMPFSTTRLKPEAAVPLAISKNSILVNDKEVCKINNFKVDPNCKEGKSEEQYMIQTLYSALDAERQKQEEIAAYNSSQQFKGLVLIMGDKDIPFRIVSEVLYTAGQAQFGNFKFVVLKNPE